MSKTKIRCRISTGEHGLAVIEETGLCENGDRAGIESGCTRRYIMEPIPQAQGAVLKPLDGTSATVYEVTPLTISRTYSCVKVDARCNPFAALQPGGDFNGKYVLAYYIKWQQVGTP